MSNTNTNPNAIIIEALNWCASTVREINDLLDNAVPLYLPTATEEQIEQAWIDECDVERAREILRRAILDKLVAEQAQEMKDEYIGPTPGVDREKLLNRVIENQERMARVMQKINRCKAALQYFRNGHRVSKKVWDEWKDALGNHWDSWWTIQKHCMGIIGSERSIWNEYFDLVHKPLDPRETYGETEEFDDQHHLVVEVAKAPRTIGDALVILDDMQSVTPKRRLDGELEAHLAEMAEYDRPYSAWERNCKPYPRYMHGACRKPSKSVVNRIEIDRQNEIRGEKILAQMKADEAKAQEADKLFDRVLDDMLRIADAYQEDDTSIRRAPTQKHQDWSLRRGSAITVR